MELKESFAQEGAWGTYVPREILCARCGWFKEKYHG